MSQNPDYILLGHVLGVHGVKGWLKVFSHTSPRLKITDYSKWFLKIKDENWTPFNVVGGRKQGKNIIALLEGVNDRNHVEALIGVKIAIRDDQLDGLSKNEYYWRDLIGLSVVTIQGVKLGQVDWVFDTGSNDVLVVKDQSGKEVRERMLPFLFESVIKSIDLDKSQMIVDWDPEF